MAIDLHIHSNHSDGSYSPRQILNLAEGLSAISITDHDTLDAYRDRELFYRSDLCIVPGIEITTYSPFEVHVLGYYIDINSNELFEKINSININRSKSLLIIANSLYQSGMIQLPISQLIRKYQYISIDTLYTEIKITHTALNIDEFYYDKKLLSGRTVGISYREAIELIAQYGGISSIAHPNRILVNPKPVMNDFIYSGGNGIECFHESYTDKDIATYLNFAHINECLVTGGSDFHGTKRTDVQLGIGRGNLNIPDKILEKLNNKRGKN